MYSSSQNVMRMDPIRITSAMMFPEVSHGFGKPDIDTSQISLHDNVTDGKIARYLKILAGRTGTTPANDRLWTIHFGWDIFPGISRPFSPWSRIS